MATHGFVLVCFIGTGWPGGDAMSYTMWDERVELERAREAM